MKHSSFKVSKTPPNKLPVSGLKEHKELMGETGDELDADSGLDVELP